MRAVALTGLRAENPLAFLAALGTMSLLGDAGMHASMQWCQHDDGWVAVVNTERLASSDDLLQAIVAAHGKRRLHQELGWTKDIMKLTRDEARDALERHHGDSEAARLVAACITELPLRRPACNFAPYTPFRLMPRRGRSQFLDAALRESQADVEHIRACLFDVWQYERDIQTMRWDPAARVQSRALMAEAPTHAKPLGVPGAVLLATRGLASFPLITERHRAIPAGMADRTRFTWPIWRDPLRLSVVRILLSAPWLYELAAYHQGDGPDRRQHSVGNNSLGGGVRSRAPDQLEAQLLAHGVIATFTALRVRRGDDDEALGWGIPSYLGEVG